MEDDGPVGRCVVGGREQKSVRMPVGAPATPGRAAGRVSCATGASARLTLLGLVRCTGETGRPGHVRGLPRLTSGPEAASELGAAGSGVDIQCCSAPPFLRCGSNLSSSHQLISMKLGTMFASRCSRLVASRTAVPLTAYLSRVGRPYSTAPAYENILTETPKPGVGLITLNRPKALNALSSELFNELNDALTKYDQDKDIGAIIITGSEKAFAAGADIKEMAPLTFSSAYNNNFIAHWSHLANNIRKPVIAAVSGYALGGGCELAMMCDIIYCTASATFGQPEIKLGVIPGAGGSQRLTRAVGKSKAMELILTGKNFSGKEAGEWGLAAKVVDGGKDELLAEAIKTAETIASYSRPAVIAAKEAVNKSQELSLKEGVDFERRLFHGLFGTKDQKIGMTAFVEKKKPEWSHE